MEKEILVGDKKISIKACASTAIRYQQVYGEHIDKEMFHAVGNGKEKVFNGGIYENAGKLLYIMAWHCNPQDMKLDRDAAVDWLDSVGSLSADNVKDIVSLFFRK